MEKSDIKTNRKLTKVEVVAGLLLAVGLTMFNAELEGYFSIPYGVGALVILLAFILGYYGVRKEKVSKRRRLSKYEVMAGLLLAVGLTLIYAKNDGYLAISYSVGSLVIIIGFVIGIFGEKLRKSKD